MARGGYPMGGGNMQQLMRQAQKMQQDLARKQQELNEATFTKSVGGGMVEVTVYGTKQVKSITINPACVDPDDVEMLQDLIVAGVNAAITEATETTERELGKLTGGLNMGF